MPRGKAKYSGEFKQRAVETMMREKLSYCEVAREYGIADHKSVARWERIYLEEGPEGLYNGGSKVGTMQKTAAFSVTVPLCLF